MPFQNFICEVTGEPVAPSACLECARKGAFGSCAMTAPVVKGILDNQRPDNFGLTVTTLLGCPRKYQLKHEHPYNEAPSALWWSFRGQLMHGVAAHYAEGDPHAIAEERFSMLVELNGEEFTITGAPDLVLTDRGHLVDYKTTKQVPLAWKQWICPETGQVIREGGFTLYRSIMCQHCGGTHNPKEIVVSGPPRARGKHVQQVQLYALLLAENGIECQTAEILYVDMERQLRIPVPLLPYEEALALLNERLAVHHQASLPDIVRTPDDLWECDYCPVRGVCESLYGAPVGKALLLEDPCPA